MKTFRIFVNTLHALSTIMAGFGLLTMMMSSCELLPSMNQPLMQGAFLTSIVLGITGAILNALHNNYESVEQLNAARDEYYKKADELDEVRKEYMVYFESHNIRKK